MVQMNSTESKEYKINKHISLRLKDGKIQLQIKNTLFKIGNFLLLNVPTDNLDYPINDYMSLRLENREINLYIKDERIIRFNPQLIIVPSSKHHDKTEMKSFPENIDIIHFDSNFI